MSRPNILWICTDQQRFDTLGCYGNMRVKTPHLDRLAERGILFENAFCQSTVCTPSRASFLTGRYPRTTRCRQNGQNIPEDEVLATRLLADAGYACGLAGKLHISACDPRVAPSGERRINDGYKQFHWSHHPEGSWPTNEYIQWLSSRGKEYKPLPIADSRFVQTGPEGRDHQTTWCAGKAIQFIEANQHFEEPWLFSVNMFDPHHPFDPPTDYLQRYLDLLEDIPLPNYEEGELENKSFFQRFDHKGAYGNPNFYPFAEMSDADHRVVRAAYWAMVDLVDEQVGRMVEALERTYQLDNTMIIFMSDHGEMLGDHGIYLKGSYFYEPSVHVPLIISYPGAFGGNRRVTDLVELVDLAPTLLEAAGLPIYPGMQGKPLTSLLNGVKGSAAHRSDVYCEHYNASSKQDGIGGFATMVRTVGYKLVVYHRSGDGELYDLESDPRETNNLWNHPQHASVQMEMMVRLCDRMAETADPLPERLAPW
ncbi:MAG TPA: sulfatase-like hydrolase/transferase [Bacilli bacterium]